jgi:hypothetical protein
MTPEIVIALCTALGAIVGWVIKILLRIEKRLTRVETLLGPEADDGTTHFVRRHSHRRDAA